MFLKPSNQHRLPTRPCSHRIIVYDGQPEANEHDKWNNKKDEQQEKLDVSKLSGEGHFGAIPKNLHCGD